MAADFIDALKEVYDALPGLPTLYRETQPEGSAREFPNAVLEDLTAKPTYDRLGARYVTAKARFTLYDAAEDGRPTAGLASVRAYKDTLVAALTVDCLTIPGQRPKLFVESVRVPSSPRRGPKQQFVYLAMIDVVGYVRGDS